MSACCECCVPEPRDHQQAAADGADDGADGVGRVNAADQPARILPFRGDRREGQRKARAPENRRRQHDPERAREIEREVVPRAHRDRRVDRPERQRERQRVGRPGNRAAEEHLHPAEREPRTFEPARQHRADAAADPEAEEEHGENQREGVDRRAEEQRERPRPDDLRRERRHAGERDRDVDRPRARRGRDLLACGRGGLVGCRASHEERQRADEDVERHGDVGRDRHVVDAQQIEAGEQAPDHGAAGVAAVEVAEPRDALRARLDPAGHRRQGRAHQDRRRQQADSWRRWRETARPTGPDPPHAV